MYFLTTMGNTVSEFVRDLCQPGLGTDGATGKYWTPAYHSGDCNWSGVRIPPAMSQVALIVRPGLFVRSAAVDLEALRDYLGRWECPGRICCPGTGWDAP